jgi:poly(3-hydroxybutyrate) depolymerase
VDPRRVFVAGMSAGAAMAVVLATTYPDRFAAVGVHSGLPYGAAHDVPSAFRAMKNGAGSRAGPGFDLPAIVFHGDGDTTVNLRNAAAIVEQATVARRSQSALHTQVIEGQSADGRGYRRTVYSDAAGGLVAEQWVLSGAGHAWSGGDPRGSFTDAAGPDASAEMVRFFLQIREGGNA